MLNKPTLAEPILAEPTLDHLYQQMTDRLADAEALIRQIQEQITTLEAEGMYPAVPKFQWQSRGSEARYLYLVFRQGSDGQYLGPEGKRKLYIGCDEVKIQEAQRLTHNRTMYESLHLTMNRLQRWLDYKKSEVYAQPDALRRKLDTINRDVADFQTVLQDQLQPGTEKPQT